MTDTKELADLLHEIDNLDLLAGRVAAGLCVDGTEEANELVERIIRKLGLATRYDRTRRRDGL